MNFSICLRIFPNYLFNHFNQTTRALPTGEKMQRCTGCNKSFGRAQDLNRHFVIHTGEKPHKCAACNKSFGEAGTLRKHMLTHTGEKPHSCAQCKKSFSQAGNLRAHILTHNAEKSTTWPPQYKKKKTLPREGSGINNFTKSNRLIARKKQLFNK